MSALDELSALAAEPENEAVKDWKAQGKKVVGFFCSYVPEEILYAANILPVRVRAQGCTATTEADVYMSHVNCSMARSCLEFILTGKYDFLDGLVFSNCCDDIRRLCDNTLALAPDRFAFVHLVEIPKKIDEDTIAWYRDALIEFKQSVERNFGVKMTDEKLKQAIDLHNETRMLLKQLYELRTADSPPIIGSETLKVIVAGMSMPKDRYNHLLRQLLEELKQRERISKYRGRLLIAGSGGCNDPAYLEVMEDLGGLIVTDTICFGSRSFWEPVQKGTGLMDGLARSYLDRPACVAMVNRVADRRRFLEKMIEDYHVDGVVYQLMINCQLWGGELLSVREGLERMNVPLLRLDREYAFSGVGQLKTRVQAFLERIER